MKGYTCDHCGKVYRGEPRVEIRGVARKSGILMPEARQEFTFCQPLCFWWYFTGQMPDRMTPVLPTDGAGASIVDPECP